MNLEGAFFEIYAKEPRFWLLYGGQHKEAADILWNAYQKGIPGDENASLWKLLSNHRGEIATHMLGMAIENTIKGIIIAREPTIVAKGKFDKRFTTHKINELAKLAEIEWEKTEDQILANKLTSYIEWYGRYPVPKNSSIPTVTFSKTDFNAAIKMFEFAQEILREDINKARNNNVR